jgi:hypothetical protein
VTNVWPQADTTSIVKKKRRLPDGISHRLTGRRQRPSSSSVSSAEEKYGKHKQDDKGCNTERYTDNCACIPRKSREYGSDPYKINTSIGIPIRRLWGIRAQCTRRANAARYCGGCFMGGWWTFGSGWRPCWAWSRLRSCHIIGRGCQCKRARRISAGMPIRTLRKGV